MFENDMHTHSTIRERVNILRDQGYRGFSLFGGKQGLEGSFRVSAKNSKGILLTADGDSLDEAYENMIEKIDYTLDDHY
jgi:hypothetical protein